jgi:hypothetical protein
MLNESTRKGITYMRFISRSGVALIIATLTMSVVAVSAASALQPEFKPSTKQGFTGASGAVRWENDEIAITCAKSTSEGEITGATTMGSVVLTFTECYATKSGTRCYFKSAGAKNAGEIITDKLKGELGEVAKAEAESKVGLLLQPEVKTEIARLESACGSPLVTGDIAAEVTPVKTSGKTLDLAFVGADGSQKIREITMKGPIHYAPQLKGESFGDLSLDFTEALTFEKALEVT